MSTSKIGKIWIRLVDVSMSIFWMWHCTTVLQNITMENWVKCIKNPFILFLTTANEFTLSQQKFQLKIWKDTHPGNQRNSILNNEMLRKLVKIKNYIITSVGKQVTV